MVGERIWSDSFIISRRIEDYKMQMLKDEIASLKSRVAALTEETHQQRERLARAGIRDLLLNDRLAAAEKAIAAARGIRAKYPGGKLLWFSEFSAFEEALAEFDAAGGKA